MHGGNMRKDDYTETMDRETERASKIDGGIVLDIIREVRELRDSGLLAGPGRSAASPRKIGGPDVLDDPRAVRLSNRS